MRVLFVTPECAPLTKTGGLGDVSAALPSAMRAQGVDVRTFLPAYRAVLAAMPQAREVARARALCSAFARRGPLVVTFEDS